MVFLLQSFVQIFFSTPRKNIFLARKKMSLENFEMFQNQKIFNEKSQILVLKFVIFHWKFSDFGTFRNFRATFFFEPKKYFFLELKKKSGQSSEAEKPYLSIARVFSSIRATRRDWPPFKCRTPSKLQNCYFFTIRSSYEDGDLRTRLRGGGVTALFRVPFHSQTLPEALVGGVGYLLSSFWC